MNYEKLNKKDLIKLLQRVETNSKATIRVAKESKEINQQFKLVLEAEHEEVLRLLGGKYE